MIREEGFPLLLYIKRSESIIMANLIKLDKAFNPGCVAIVGDSARIDFTWLRSQRDFTGKLYSVQVSPASIKQIEAFGIENYTSLLDIPEHVNLYKKVIAIIRKPKNPIP